jgi:septal ring factor EnvC (AmiA/AmiB activator)
MKETQELQDTIRRQAEEIRSLKAERCVLRRERKAYRRRYLQIMCRINGLLRQQDYQASLWSFLKEQAAKYPTIANNPHAILQDEGKRQSNTPSRCGALML